GVLTGHELTPLGRKGNRGSLEYGTVTQRRFGAWSTTSTPETTTKTQSCPGIVLPVSKNYLWTTHASTP
ncbi:hypothetical protein KEM55_007758, partial [Ascosphaera atra]